MDGIDKENVIGNEKKSRSRGDNWTQEEKELFMEIMENSAPIIENKRTDTNTNKRKHLEWLKVQNKLNELTGKLRDIQQLKGFWRRCKLAAKKSMSLHKKAIHATGGGQKPPSPPPNDLKIMEMCPTDFIIEENLYDSDAVSQTHGQDNLAADATDDNNKTIYDLDDINENIDNTAELSFVDEVITITDVHNNEIDIKPSGEHKKVKVPKMKRMDASKKKNQKNDTCRGAIMETNIEIKKRAMLLMEEEYSLKIKFQKQEIAHQQLRHKLEIEILMLEKEKKQLELADFKKLLQE